MYAENDRISMRQVFRLLFFQILGITTLVLPGKIAECAGRNGSTAVLAGGILVALYLQVLGRILRQPGSYREKLQHNFGETGQKVIYFLYGAGLIGAGSYVLGKFGFLIRQSLLKEESGALVLALIMVLAVYSVCFGIEGRARVYEILFWFLLIPLAAAFLLACKDLDGYWMLQLWNYTSENWLEGMYLSLAGFSVLGMLPFLQQYTNRTKELTGMAQRVCCSLIAAFLLIYLILLGTFGAESLAQIPLPVTALMSIVKIPGGFLKQQDALMTAIWFFMIFTLLAGILFYAGICLSPGTKSHSRQSVVKYGILGVLVYALAVWVENSAAVTEMVENIVLFGVVPFLYVMPLFSWQKKPAKENRAEERYSRIEDTELEEGELQNTCVQKGAEDQKGKKEVLRAQNTDFRHEQKKDFRVQNMDFRNEQKKGFRTQNTDFQHKQKSDSKIQNTGKTNPCRIGKITVLLAGLGILSLTLTGCSSRELEDRNFPLAVGLDYENEECTTYFGFQALSDSSDEAGSGSSGDSDRASDTLFYSSAANFTAGLLSSENKGTRQLDTNHVKVVILGETFLNQKEQLYDFLSVVQQENWLPRNTLVFTCGQVSELFAAEEELGKPVGTYLEQLMENQQNRRQKDVVTVGDLLNDYYNRERLLLLPVITAQNGVLVVSGYYAVDKLEMKGEISLEEGDVAMLCQNQLKTFSYQTSDGKMLQFDHLKAAWKSMDEEEVHLTLQSKIKDASAYEIQNPVENQKQSNAARMKNAGQMTNTEDWEVEFLRYVEHTIEILKQEPGIDVTESYHRLPVYDDALYQKYRLNPSVWELHTRIRLTVIEK